MNELRRQLMVTAQRMEASGLGRGTAGNVSVRIAGTRDFLITPSGMPYADLLPEEMVLVRSDGSATGLRAPSSEWRFHRDLYAQRADSGAVLHAHSPFATSLACLRRELPPFHYMIARFGGDTLRCAVYATFGTQELSDAILRAIADRRGCLLANHGMVVIGEDLAQALALAVELEALCEQYWRACQLGEPVLLDGAEMRTVLEMFSRYGQRS